MEIIDKNRENYQEVGGYFIAPNDVLSTPKFTPGTKFVYLLLRYLDTLATRNHTKFTPAYTYIKQRFGVSANTYHSALSQLSEAGHIHSHIYQTITRKNYLSVTIPQKQPVTFEKIPVLILTTTVYTYQQKIFLCMLWQDFCAQLNSLTTLYRTTGLIRNISQKGISRRSAITYLRQLSDPGYGYIPILVKNNDYTFTLDTTVLQAVYHYDQQNKAEKGYTKPFAQKYIWSPTEQNIRKSL